MKRFISVALLTATTLAPVATGSKINEYTSDSRASIDDIIIKKPCVPWRKCDKHTGQD